MGERVLVSVWKQIQQKSWQCWVLCFNPTYGRAIALLAPLTVEIREQQEPELLLPPAQLEVPQ
jgi:hypothetical protein